MGLLFKSWPTMKGPPNQVKYVHLPVINMNQQFHFFAIYIYLNLIIPTWAKDIESLQSQSVVSKCHAPHLYRFPHVLRSPEGADS